MFNNKDEFKSEFAKRAISRFGREVSQIHLSEKYYILGDMIRDYVSNDWKRSKEYIVKYGVKQLTYLSMEFLIGRLLASNLLNLGIYDVTKDGLQELGIDIEQIEKIEIDAALGNGGLGRLAACYMDSIVTLGYVGHGNTIRYDFGFFKQKIENNRQVEVPDQWLKYSNVWEIYKPKHAVEIQFYGRVITSIKENGELNYELVDAEHVRAVPYDVPVIGYQSKVINTLRLWSAEPSDERLPKRKKFEEYLTQVRQICLSLYPDDSYEEGKILRLKQQYFLASATIQSLVRYHNRTYNDFENFALKNVIQLNDTHPVLAIPELMRILMDEKGFGWDKAWNIVTNTFAYTNHTLLSEALEKWPTELVKKLLPRIYMIIEEIDRRSNLYARVFNSDENKVRKVMIIKDSMIYMANLAVWGSFSVNGVAKLHTNLLISQEMKEAYSLFPSKFNNQTNGVTHRRWLMYANKELSSLITSLIGKDWETSPLKLEELLTFIDNEDVQNRFLDIKKQKKLILKKYIKEHNNIEIDENSLFSIQVKRIHAYKRQTLNILYAIYLYKRMKGDSNFRIYPQTFIFGGKAAPSYYFAKKVIQLINQVAEVINNDDEVNKFIKVIFIENYDVSKAEMIMTAADISIQISTAGKEASGTGNMKFMMNGAITLGTLDGANVEIVERVGEENAIIFGLKDHEVLMLTNTNGYYSKAFYESNPYLKMTLNSLIDGSFSNGDKSEFEVIFEDLVYHNDYYFVLADFDEYIKANEKARLLYLDKNSWAKKCLINIAKSGFFSSDRSIKGYVDDIWHIEKLYLKDKEE